MNHEQLTKQLAAPLYCTWFSVYVAAEADSSGSAREVFPVHTLCYTPQSAHPSEHVVSWVSFKVCVKEVFLCTHFVTHTPVDWSQWLRRVVRVSFEVCVKEVFFPPCTHFVIHPILVNTPKWMICRSCSTRFTNVFEGFSWKIIPKWVEMWYLLMSKV